MFSDNVVISVSRALRAAVASTVVVLPVFWSMGQLGAWWSPPLDAVVFAVMLAVGLPRAVASLGAREFPAAAAALLAGAAAFEAMRMYEHHREREGIPEHHELAKELLAGFAAAEIEKHFDEGRYGHLNRHEARRMAQQQADYLWQEQYGRR